MFFKLFFKRVTSILSRDILVSIISLIITTYLVNNLGAESFGLWIGVVTLQAIFDLLFRFKLEYLLVYYSKEYPSDTRLYIRICSLNLCLLVVGFVIILFFNEDLIEFFNLSSKFLLILIFANFSLSVFGNVVFYIFLSESKYAAYNFSVLGQYLALAVAVFLLFNTFERSIIFVVLAYIISWFFVLLFFLVDRIFLRRLKTLEFHKPLNLSHNELIKRGIPIYCSAAIKGVSDQVSRIFAINFLTVTTVGHLGLAQIIIGLLNRVPAAVSVVLYPMLVKDTEDKLNRSVGIIRILLIIYIPIILLLELFMPILVILFYGEKFSIVAFYLQIILPFAYFGLPGFILLPYFASRGEFKILLRLNASSILVSIFCL